MAAEEQTSGGGGKAEGGTQQPEDKAKEKAASKAAPAAAEDDDGIALAQANIGRPPAHEVSLAHYERVYGGQDTAVNSDPEALALGAEFEGEDKAPDAKVGNASLVPPGASKGGAS